MRSDKFNSRAQTLLEELERYIGTDYLVRNNLMLGESTRFDQLNFDIVDEVVTEHMIEIHFGLNGFTCNPWPGTVGELVSILRSKLDGR